MELSGEHVINASAELIWEALSDPDIIRGCLPGCGSAEIVWDALDETAATVRQGPVSGRFNCNFITSDIDAANGYTNSGAGEAGFAAVATGSVHISLSGEGSGTRVTYWLDAELNGYLGALGTDAVKTAAPGYINGFFGRLADRLAAAPHPAGEVAKTADATPHEDRDHDPTNPHYFGIPLGVLIGAGIAALSVAIISIKFLR
jgi:carbon monoxide dehydrogenase subunit G